MTVPQTLEFIREKTKLPRSVRSFPDVSEFVLTPIAETSQPGAPQEFTEELRKKRIEVIEV